jgi:hydrogenase expression/formation protein HypD
MRYLDEPWIRRGEGVGRRHPATATRQWTIMEVCGGQTHSIIRNGIDQLLDGAAEFIHGPVARCASPRWR